MDPLFEQRLRDEVIFLHALWYQGPPGPPRPNAAGSSAVLYHLQPSSPGAEWPHRATPPPPTAWPAAPIPTPKPPPPSAEEQSKLAGKYAHNHAVKVVHKFFTRYNADGFDEIDSSDDDDDDDQLMDEDCGDEEINFFFKLFEDSVLRDYYEKNFVIGEFPCLVCGALGGKNTGKKFKGCLPLVQHSITIGKTKKRKAHRAFAQAVCKVLGWEIDRLPQIVSMLSDKLGNSQGNGNGNGNGESSVASVQNVDSVKVDAVEGKDDGPEPASDAGENLEAVGLTTNFVADKTGNEVCPRVIAVIASTSANVPIIRNHPHPSKATQFKKMKRKCKNGTKLANNVPTESNSSHGANWQCHSQPHLPSTSGCPTTGPSLKLHQVSTEEQLILAGKHAHQHALKVVYEFLQTNDPDEIDSDSDDDYNDDESMDENGGSEVFGFFFKVFEEDTTLREYYMKNFAEGEFSCLICGAMGGKKTVKKFKGCLPLIHHLTNITKTKRKAHRAFGQAVCKVLGWNIDHLPAFRSIMSDKTGDPQISSTCADANKTLENPGMVHQQNTEESASRELTINSLVCPEAGDNENMGMVHQVMQPASEGSKIAPLNEEQINASAAGFKGLSPLWI